MWNSEAEGRNVPPACRFSRADVCPPEPSMRRGGRNTPKGEVMKRLLCLLLLVLFVGGVVGCQKEAPTKQLGDNTTKASTEASD